MSVVSTATSKLTLLGPASMRPFRCLWMLEELHLQYKHIPKAVPQSRFIKKYNPLGKVPVLLIHDSDEEKFGSDHQQETVEIQRSSMSSASTVPFPAPTATTLPSRDELRTRIEALKTSLDRLLDGLAASRSRASSVQSATWSPIPSARCPSS